MKVLFKALFKDQNIINKIIWSKALLTHCKLMRQIIL
jgi:hypothetical protein